MNYLSHCTPEDIKRIRKKLKEVAKDTRNSRPRKFFLSVDYITYEDVFSFLQEQNKYVLNRIKEERARAWEFLNDESKVEEYGWNSRKPNPERLMEWADLAYPSINVDAMELEYDLLVLEKYE